MYKLISYYRSVSDYPGNARIVKVTESDYALYIKHDVAGLVLYRKGSRAFVEYCLFNFIPFGYTRPIFWKKVKANGN